MQPPPPLIRWNRSSTILLSGFFLTVFLIIYVWWPLAKELLATIDWRGPWWLYMDWLLVGIFLFMSVDHRGACRSAHRQPDHSGRDHRRARDRGLGHADQPVALLHQRTASAMDRPRLADLHAGNRSHATGVGLHWHEAVT